MALGHAQNVIWLPNAEAFAATLPVEVLPPRIHYPMRRLVQQPKKTVSVNLRFNLMFLHNHLVHAHQDAQRVWA